MAILAPANSDKRVIISASKQCVLENTTSASRGQFFVRVSRIDPRMYSRVWHVVPELEATPLSSLVMSSAETVEAAEAAERVGVVETEGREEVVVDLAGEVVEDVEEEALLGACPCCSQDI